jgi:hypothetical protein
LNFFTFSLLTKLAVYFRCVLSARRGEAANRLQASCPIQTPQTPIDRFDALGKRLDAMVEAIKKVRPELASF